MISANLCLSKSLLKETFANARAQISPGINHTDYPENTIATDNNRRSWNQQAGIECKYLSRNNLPGIKLIRGKLFPDRYLLPVSAYELQ